MFDEGRSYVDSFEDSAHDECYYIYDAGWTQEILFDSTSTDDATGAWTYHEEADFTPTDTAGDATYDDGGAGAYVYTSNGTEAWSFSDEEQVYHWSVVYSDGQSSDYVYAEDNLWDYTLTGTDWTGSYIGSSSYDETGGGSWSANDQGDFDFDPVIDDWLCTGEYLSHETEDWLSAYTGGSSGEFFYDDGTVTGGYDWAYIESGSGGGAWQETISTTYSPTEGSGLYDYTEQTASIYAYSGSGSSDYEKVENGTTTTWGDAYTYSAGGTYAYSYDDAGLTDIDGELGAYRETETTSDSYDYATSGYYGESFVSGENTRSRSDLWHEAATNDWTGSYEESGGYGPGGDEGVYESHYTYDYTLAYDGSGTAEKADNDITITTADTVAVGDVVTAKGKVLVDKDFGAGYAYPVIVEDAKVAK